MDKKNLYKKAGELKSPSISSIKDLEENKSSLLKAVNDKMCARKDINQMVGENNIEMMLDNHSNHLLFMIAIYKEYHPEVFIDTISWVFRAYRSRGFQTTYWAAQLNTWIKVHKNELSENTYSEVFPFYEFILTNIASFVNISESESKIKYPLS